VISHFPFVRILTFKIVICQTLKASVLLCNQASLSLIKISVITSQYLLRVKPETSEEASCSHYLGSSRYFIVTKKDKHPVEAGDEAREGRFTPRLRSSYEG